MTLALLRDACKKGSLQKLKDNLKICQEQDIDPFSNFFSRPETLFHIASESKASGLEILEELVTEFRYWSSKTPRHRKYKGSGINSYLRDSLNSEGYTALHCACKSNKSDYVYVFVKELRFYGVYCRSCKRVPFECKCISFEMMYEYTPFEVACLHCCSDIALFLLKKCQRVFGDFSNGIILAYDSGFRDFIITVCLKHKVTVKVLNSLCCHERFEIVDFCIREHLCKQEGKQLVHMAASNGEVDLLRYCDKKKGFDIASVDKSGVNILHIACSANKIECVKFVLESNYLSLAVKKNKKGERPINLSESEEIVELIKTHLHLNELHSFCLRHEPSYFMIPLDKTKLITEQYISEQDAVGNTPLHYACENGQAYIIEAILSQMSVLNLNLQNDDGNTAVHLLVCCLSKTIRELYASDKYQLSQLGSKTAQVRHIITSLKEMINHSSFNFSLCNKKEETVAFLILTQLVLTDKRFDDLLSLIPGLVQKLYDSKWFSNDFLRIISHYCQHCYRSRYLKKNYRGKSRVHPFVKLLKDTTSPEFILDSTIKDSKGNTCLHYAAACNWSELVIYLVTSTKCDVSIKNQDDKTPLQCIKPLCQNISSLLESCSIYEHLIENGAQINSAPVDKNANTILHIACIAKSHKLLKRLIELDDTKKMVVAVNKAGKTPLHLLCSRSNYFVSVEYFELLLKVPDVDVMCRTKSGRTPLEILTENVNKKLIVYERIRKSVCLIVQHDTFKPEMYIKPEYLEIWCKIGITKFVEQIISSDETLVNRVNDHNQNLLHFACFNFNFDVFDFLLQKSSGELVTAPDRFGFTPFHCICWRVWKIEKLDKIMSLENFISSKKAHNLLEMIKIGLPMFHSNKLIKAILSLTGIDPLISSKKAHNLLEMIKTGLPMFRSYNRNELIKAILTLNGIDQNLRNCFPLNCTRIEADNVTNDRRNTKLHIACKSPLVNKEEIISLLSQSGTDISITNNKNQTALHVLIENYMYADFGMYTLFKSHHSYNSSLLSIPDSSGNTCLHLACKCFFAGVSIVKDICDQVDLINVKNKEGNTPLHLVVCWHCNEEVISLLLSRSETDISITNNENQTALHVLIEYYADFDMYTLFKSHHSYNSSLLSIPDSSGNTCLHLACKRSYLPIVKDICDDQANLINVKNKEGNTPLHLVACQYSNKEVIILLLSQSETDISITNNENQTALHVLIENADSEMYTLFKSHRSYNSSLLSIPDSSGNTCLHLACKRSRLSIVKDICDDQVCLINVKNKEGNTPLHLVACQYSKFKVYDQTDLLSVFGYVLFCSLFHDALEVAKHIISRDENTLNALNNENQTALHFNCFLAVIFPNCNLAKQDTKGNNPIHYLFLHNLYQQIFMENKWEELVQNETFENSINQQNEDGNTFLHLACMHVYSDDANLQIIIDSVLSFSSCDIMILNSEKKKAFDYCSLNALVAFCLKCKYLTASVKSVKKGRTVLHLACVNSNDLIKILSEAMDDINIQDDDGLTPFHCYCLHNMSKTSDDWQYLVFHPSFNPNVQDNTGCTALHYICRSYHPNISLAKELLTNEKTNINIKNSNGNTCFHLISPRNSELISLFQDQNPFCLLLNPFHELDGNDLHCLQVCTLSGSPLANIDSKQNTPLHIACRALCPPFIKKLLQKCKKHLSADFPTNKSNQTPLHMLALGVKSLYPQLHESYLFAQRKKLQRLHTHDWYLLLKCGINKQDHLGNTALHYTCQSQNTLLLKALTKSKLCDFSIRNNTGELPLTTAMKTGSRSFFLKVLIKYFESQGKEFYFVV